MPKRSKKTKRLGPVRVIRPEQYDAFDVNSELEYIRALIPLGLRRLHELLEEKVSTLASKHYARKAAQFTGRRHTFCSLRRRPSLHDHRVGISK